MADLAKSRKLLLDYIADEDLELRTGESDDFASNNHSKLEPLIPKASKLLEAKDLRRFYFHRLRHDFDPKIKTPAEFAVLLEAYKDVTALFPTGLNRVMFHPMKGLLLFGFDELGALPDEPAPDLETYQTFLKVWRQATNYVSIPYMLDKPARFGAFATPEITKRIVKVFRYSRYLNNRRDPAIYGYNAVALWYWGLVFITLLNVESAAEVMNDFVAATDLPERSEHLEILGRFMAGAGFGEPEPS